MCSDFGDLATVVFSFSRETAENPVGAKSEKYFYHKDKKRDSSSTISVSGRSKVTLSSF